MRCRKMTQNNRGQMQGMPGERTHEGTQFGSDESMNFWTRREENAEAGCRRNQKC